ncbi:hypothetical protein GQ600_3798 [Phytophthora cactorum]|nr:hypothetical protein GQ600_3798 [Phytophthora cactorum]
MADVDWDELEIQVAKIRRSTPLLEATPEAIEALLDRDAANPPLLFDEVQTTIFWDTSSFDGNDWLFPGSNQCERFRKCLHRLLESEDVAEALTRRCVNRDDLEAHSTRKGSTTYCGSGSTACPSSKFVHLRAGRPLGGVQSTYLLYASTGDIILSANSSRFSRLYCFLSGSSTIVQASFAGVSAVSHPILISDLAAKVYGIESTTSCSILGKERIAGRDSQNCSNIDTAEWLREGDNGRAQKRAIGAGVITFDSLETSLKQCLESAKVTEFVNKLNASPQQTASLDNKAIFSNTVILLGRPISSVSPDFELPTDL